MAPSLGLGFMAVLLLAVSCVVFEPVNGFAAVDDPREYAETEGIFLLQESKQILKTEAGEVRMARGGEGTSTGHISITFIRMEPKSLFLPQYLDADIVLYLHRGSAKLGWIHRGDLLEKNLRIGDAYRIPGGSVFYLVNTDETRLLEVFCCVDTLRGLKSRGFQSFLVAGGLDPKTVYSGFDEHTLSKAFNVSHRQLECILGKQTGGPIIYITDKQLDGIRSSLSPDRGAWRWSRFVESFIVPNGRDLEPYNVLNKNPDFHNNYGWSIAVDSNDYPPLAASDIGIFYVNLTAGSMVAPHVNPCAREYAIVTEGEGRIQIAFPNGTSAMDVKVRVGDVFFVPRYFPICQTASLDGPMEFFGFSTSARGNRPLFLAGSNSVLNAVELRVLAAAFSANEKELGGILNAQKEAVILPTVPVEEEEEEEKKKEDSFFNILMGFR